MTKKNILFILLLIILSQLSLSFIIARKSAAPPPMVTVTTNPATTITCFSATGGGSIDSRDNIDQRGICWSTSANPTANLATKTTNGSGVGSFTANITGLSPNTTYHVRAYAINRSGTFYGSDLVFTSKPLPSVTTRPVTNVTGTGATSGGNVLQDGGFPITSRGVCWSTSVNPTVSLATKTSNGSGTGSFTSNITGLSLNTTYHVRAYAINSTGTYYGADLVFTVKALPTVTTNPVSDITVASAFSGGVVLNQGTSSVIQRGLCFSSTTTNPNIVADRFIPIGSGTGSFTGQLSRLSPNTTYYVRAFATNSSGTAYGDPFSFKTQPSVTIGTQVWSQKNLDVTRYRNGDIIPQVTDPVQWENLTTGAWCYYNNSSANGVVYGKLYNWYAVNDPRGLAPAGWHVPTDAERTTILNFLGGNSLAGGKMKSLTLWESPNEGATNSSGFSALPGGYRNQGGDFYELGTGSYFWSSTEDNTDALFAWYCHLVNDWTGVGFGTDGKPCSFSVRCIKD